MNLARKRVFVELKTVQFTQIKIVDKFVSHSVVMIQYIFMFRFTFDKIYLASSRKRKYKRHARFHSAINLNVTDDDLDGRIRFSDRNYKKIFQEPL